MAQPGAQGDAGLCFGRFSPSSARPRPSARALGNKTKRAAVPMEQSRSHKILTDIGLILGPATLVGIFAPVMDISTRDTAVLSLATVFLISLCHYRQKVNSFVPSSLALAILLVCILIYYFAYENILLKDTGLISYTKKSNDYLGELSKLIAEAKDEVLFFGTDFHITVEDKREDLLKKLSEGVNIKYLVLNPKSKRLDLLASDFDVNTEKLRSESQDGLQGLITLNQRWSEVKNRSENPGSLEVRLFEASPKMRAYFFDGATGHGRAYLVPYMNKLNSPQSPGYLFSVKKDGVAEIYLAGIRKLWQEAIPLENVAPQFIKN